MKVRALVWSAAVVFSSAGLAHGQLSESFDDILQLPGAGWFEQNNSSPIGVIGYFQGNLAVFGPHATAGYLGVNFNSGSGLSTTSNWMVTPVLDLENGREFKFWTRTVDAPAFPDRLQVRMSTAGSSTNVGTSPTDVGDFTALLLDINPTYTTTAYPSVWTEYTVTVSGVGSPTQGRIAFRYFAENAGPSGTNSDYIGIDEVSYAGGGGGGCYANCDGSTQIPFLNVNDFVCFQQQFAAGNSVANCDGSTAVPVLNVDDFVCFQQAFAAGCSAP
jgi:hypothetical protein